MLQVSSLNIRYGEKKIIRDFTLDVNEGEVLTIIGPNGSGKSTVLKAITRLIPCESGRICIANQELQQFNSKQLSRIMCLLCQSNMSPADMTVEELVGYGRMPHKKWYERINVEDKEIIHWAMELTGMTLFRERRLVTLSGGEAQRAWLAMALAQRPKVLLLDEPTTYLDIAHQLEVLELVRTLNRELKLTVIMVLHDLNHASAYSDRVCVIKEGGIRMCGTPRTVFTSELIRSVYGVDTDIQDSPDGEHPRIHVLNKWNKEARNVNEAAG
ncbi:ABC transporter ATP-binding protein [Paenibacillus alvei]|uniref:ABC transporter ATP-binding protein n=1 Tax=Paenibacillus alvei TaxID=44250 RepID=A0ABT4GZ01_PAEAL|nr:ABC transporter ATP-binding protein [Paenibacillus alvei]EJW16087.1 iron(3+)-hydroxamate import ATP-binding protein FhuC [Paenibacillus alvei DSM 29]MCY7482904.1 ABC transporter ATP-binding protein [Paenibacillus alvei]MCY9541215.1 ABC transporter ATP-binding protein [Paenibacillus alvei]MCY9704568.1 ABC transporter ATP-binding protein [Paenibacillus alvei]MCY9732772.1 ABC transporter ATP-binding protein [Paenibacillus alvei]